MSLPPKSQARATAAEYRLPRAMATRTIEQICRKLDAKSSGEVDYREWDGRMSISDVTILAVWIVGSYARGALDCGDIDLVVNVTLNMHPDTNKRYRFPPTRSVNRVFLGKMPRVRAYMGTPDGNGSGVAFPEAKLIWARDDGDWMARLHGIAADPSAGRFSRPSDDVPFRREQLDLTSDGLEDILELKQAGILKWKFVPLSDITPRPLESLDESDYSFKFGYKFQFNELSETARRMLPFVLAYMGDIEQMDIAQWRGEAAFLKGYSNRGAKIAIGRPQIALRCLDHLDTSSLIICPKYTARGPNGIWEIERGTHHPMNQLFDGITGWIVTKNGVPFARPRKYQATHRRSHLDLFREEALARAYADNLQAHDVHCDLGIQELRGEDIPAVISRVEGVTVWPQEFEYTFNYRREEWIVRSMKGLQPYKKARKDPILTAMMREIKKPTTQKRDGRD